MENYKLQTEGLRKVYPGTVALDNFTAGFDGGKVHAIIGKNGSGKSTLIKIISGAIQPTSGTLRVDGSEIKMDTPLDAFGKGIATVYQELSLIPDLTVLENMFLGSRNRGRFGFIDQKSQEKTCRDALSLFEEVISKEVTPHCPVNRLTPDERQIVEILKVLIRKPEVIILDEATSSLHSSQVKILFDIVRDLKKEGTSVIMISHKMKELFEIGDRATIIRNGETVATVELDKSSHDEIVTHMVGEKYFTKEKTNRNINEEILLEAIDLSAGNLKKINFSLKKGEILGLSGLQGQGQSELLQTLFGNNANYRGKLALGGRELTLKSPGKSVKDGFAYISGDRKKHGVFLIRSILENTSLAYLRKSGRLIFKRKKLKTDVLPILERLNLVFDGLDSAISQLSGGNQQKVIIGRWLMTDPKVILMDDPTKGVDIKTKEELYSLMKKLCDNGVSIIWNSSEDQEILQNADRVLVFNDGRIVDELRKDRLNEYELYKAAMV